MFLWISLACQSYSAALRAGTLNQKTRAKAFFFFFWGYCSLDNCAVSWATVQPLRLHRQQHCLSPAATARSEISIAKQSMVSPVFPGSGTGENVLPWISYQHNSRGCPIPPIISSISTRAAFFLSSPTILSHPLPFRPMLAVSEAFCVFLLGSRLISSALQAGLYSDEHPC